jgi:F0F1-type ATP synthase membrane subunit b/b'
MPTETRTDKVFDAAQDSVRAAIDAAQRIARESLDAGSDVARQVQHSLREAMDAVTDGERRSKGPERQTGS